MMPLFTCPTARLAPALLLTLVLIAPCFAAPHAPETPVVAPVADGGSEPAATPPPDSIELRDFMVLPAVGHYGRLAVQQDAVELQQITGKWKAPTEGEMVVTGDGGTKAWRAATAKANLLDTHALRGGYAFTKFDSPVERVMLLEAAGHAAVYFNGELHTGDPYNLGWLRLPVLVRKGENTLLFHLAGEQLSARLVKPPADVFLMSDDRTLPTLVHGETENVLGAVPIVNASGNG